MSTKHDDSGGAAYAAPGGGGGATSGQWTLCEVRIVYRNPGGQVKEKEVDLNKAGGIWWNNPGNAGPGPGAKVPGKVKPGNPDDCPSKLLGLGPGDQCWWDSLTNQWICPNGWE